MSLQVVRFIAVLLLMQFPVLAAPIKLDFLRVGSKVYSNVTVIGANATDLYFTHAQGISNAKLRYLEPVLQKRFHYNAATAAEAEREQFKEDALFVNQLGSNLVAKAEKAAEAARLLSITSETSLADPISDQSLLGKKAPAIPFETWLGEKPAMEGKFVLLLFWEPWSIPCRRIIPEFNALQRKYSARLAIIGVESGSGFDPGESVSRPEFAAEIDSKAKISKALGVTSVPFAVLVDDKGVVRYQGHPAAIEETWLQRVLAPGP